MWLVAARLWEWKRLLGLTSEDFSYGSNDFLWCGEGFYEEESGVKVANLAEGVFVIGVAEDDNGDFGDILVFCERSQYIEPVHDGHLKVEKNNVWMLGANEAEAGLAILRSGNVKSFGCECDSVHFAHIRLIVDKADFSSFGGEFRCRIVHSIDIFLRASLLYHSFFRREELSEG